MADCKSPYLDKIRRITESCLAGERVRIYLFGSFARNRAGVGSDVDIAVEYLKDYNRSKIAELRERLEESTIPYRVDVVDMAMATERLCREIRRDGVLWQE